MTLQHLLQSLTKTENLHKITLTSLSKSYKISKHGVDGWKAVEINNEGDGK